jgi:hypothetical protein
MINGLSDHDALLLMINELNLPEQTCPTKTIRNMNKNSVMEFQIKLSCELWDNVFNSDNDDNVDILFNSFLNSYLRIFHSSFPTKKINNRMNKKPWITSDIKVMCQYKKPIFTLVGVAVNLELKNSYKSYSKNLTKAILEAKKTWYNKQILASNNKIKQSGILLKLRQIERGRKKIFL